MPRKLTPGSASQPLFDQISTIVSHALLERVLRVLSLARQKLPAAAAENHIKAVTIGHFHQLSSDISTTCSFGFIRGAGTAFPVAVRAMGIGTGRCSVGNTRCGDNARGHTRLLGQLCQGGQGIL